MGRVSKKNVSNITIHTWVYMYAWVYIPAAALVVLLYNPMFMHENGNASRIAPRGLVKIISHCLHKFLCSFLYAS